MGIRTLLVLLLVAGALGATLWFTSEKPPVEERAETHALDGRSLRQCKRVRWQLVDQPAVEVVVGDNGTFQLVEPIEDRASVGFLQQIVSAWDSANLLATEYADDADGRRETGLDEPRLTFLVEWPDGHRIEYDIGGLGPLGEDRFLRRDGKIWRGHTVLYESMRVNLDDLRDRQVFLHRELNCSELRVAYLSPSGHTENLHLERAANRNWRMLQPFDGRAEPEAAVKFVTAVLTLRADVFIASLVRVPKRPPDVTVEAKGGLGTEKLEMWIEGGAAFGQFPGRTGWFQCDPQTFEAGFTNASQYLRARTLVGLNDVATELAEVAIDPGQGRGDRIRLSRESVGEDWRLVEPTEFPVDPTPANELVQAINNLRALDFVDDRKVDDPELGLSAGRLAVAVRGFEQREAMTLWLGRAVKHGDMDMVYACRADEPGTIMLVPAPAVERLRREWQGYCARQVLKILVPIERLEIRRGVGGGERVYARDGDHWVEEGVPGARDEIGEFCNDELKDLLAKNVIDLRGQRFGEPDWILKICRINGDPLVTLRVWDRGDEQPVVLQPEREQDVGFEVGVRASKQLRELWR